MGKDVLVLPSNWPIPEDNFRANILDGALYLSDGPQYSEREELERSVLIISEKNLPKFIEWLNKQVEAQK